MKDKLLKIIKTIWGGVKTPLIIFMFFYFGGMGFYKGFVNANFIDVLNGEKVILIHMIDVSKIEEQEND